MCTLGLGIWGLLKHRLSSWGMGLGISILEAEEAPCWARGRTLCGVPLLWSYLQVIDSWSLC